MAQDRKSPGKLRRRPASKTPVKSAARDKGSHFSRKSKPQHPYPAKSDLQRPSVNTDRSTKPLSGGEMEFMDDLFGILVETIPAAIFVLQGSRTIYMNPAALVQSGYGREELLSRPFWEIVYPDHQKLVKERSLEHQNGEMNLFRHEIKIISKTGEAHWMEYRGGVFEFQGKPIALATVFDITEQKQAERSLREAEERYRDLYENVPSMYFTVDPQGRVISVNEYGASQLGYTVEELQNQSVLQVFRPEDHAAVLQQLEVCQRLPGVVHQWELQKIRKDGSRLWVEEFARLVEDRQGNPHILIVCQDITARKKMEEALREAGEQLEQRVRQRTAELEKANADLQREIGERKQVEEELKKHRDHLEELVQERTARLQKINRELRREIQSRKRTEAALHKTGEELRRLSAHRESAREEERAQIAREIHDELGQLLSISQMNLTWMEMNLERDPASLRSKIHSTSELIGNIIKAVQRISRELRPSVLEHLGFPAALAWQTREFQAQTGIRCKLAIRTKQLQLPEDVSLGLFRVFQEALTNVLRHAKASEISIVLESKDQNLRLSVADNGVGINKEAFNDLNALGLIGIRERIHGLNGAVKITGSPSRGTRLTVSVPLK